MIDLRQFDVILVNTSAGKDSQAMMHEVYQLAEAQGVTDRLVAVHCDLGRVEWEGTRELAEEHAAHYGIRFEVVSRRQGDLLQHVEQRGMWPSSAARYCTSDHKRGQVDTLITRLVEEQRAQGVARPRVLNCLGIRADESPARKKRVPLTPVARITNSRREVWEWLPLHDWTAERVWATIRAAGTRPHPAYAKGMPRLSCCFCIFAPKGALMIAARENPGLFQEYVQLEERIGHTFRQDLALADVARELAAGAAAGPITDQWNM